MLVIWKFPLGLFYSQRVIMPNGARVLSVQIQRGVPTLWAICNPNERPTERKFEIIGTGQPFEWCEREFVGTVQNGGVVWHVFERV